MGDSRSPRRFRRRENGSEVWKGGKREAPPSEGTIRIRYRRSGPPLAAPDLSTLCSQLSLKTARGAVVLWAPKCNDRVYMHYNENAKKVPDIFKAHRKGLWPLNRDQESQQERTESGTKDEKSSFAPERYGSVSPVSILQLRNSLMSILVQPPLKQIRPA